MAKLNYVFSRFRQSHGFTLIQLLTVIAIMGMMVGAGSAVFADVVHRKVVRSAALQLEKRLEFIVQQSKGKGDAMAICAGQTTTCSSTDWSLGYVTLGSNPVSDTSGQVKVLHRVEAMDPVVQILAKQQKTIFLPGGFLANNEDAVFYICPVHRAGSVYKINVSTSGLVDFQELDGQMICNQVRL